MGLGDADVPSLRGKAAANLIRRAFVYAAPELFSVGPEYITTKISFQYQVPDPIIFEAMTHNRVRLC